jgi:hypothetical protein
LKLKLLYNLHFIAMSANKRTKCNANCWFFCHFSFKSSL